MTSLQRTSDWASELARALEAARVEVVRRMNAHGLPLSTLVEYTSVVDNPEQTGWGSSSEIIQVSGLHDDRPRSLFGMRLSNTRWSVCVISWRLSPKRSPPILSAANPADGYLLVRVPASPRAPHMVDDRYWGRGDKTKRTLSDAEVELLIARRAGWAVNAEKALSGWIAQDPINLPQQANGHLFVVASPVPPRERMLLEAMTATGDFTAVFRDLVARTKHNGGSFAPDMPSHMSNFSTTADGWAWKSYAAFGQREEGAPSDRESRSLMVEICENGQLRLFCGRAAEQLGTSGYGAGFFLLDVICLGLTARMVSLACGASQAAGYLGSWDFGVGVTGIKGAKSYSRFESNQFAGPSYTAEKYTLTTRASQADLEAGSGRVLERLFGRVIRAIGADHIEANKRHFA